MKAQKIRFSATGENAYEVSINLQIKANALIEMGYPSFNVIYNDDNLLVGVEMDTNLDDKDSRLEQLFKRYVREYGLELN